MTVIMVIIIWRRFDVFQNIKKLPKFHTCWLQSLNMCTWCHTAHIQRIDNFLPDSLQHIRCSSSQNSHNSILQSLQRETNYEAHRYTVFHILSYSLGSSILLVTLKPNYESLLISTSRRVRDRVSYSYEIIGKSGGTTAKIKLKYT
jgi:hypothetical protein